MEVGQRSGSGWPYAIALLLGLAIAIALLVLIVPVAYLYRHPDGSHYLEAARNFLAGKSLMVTANLDKFPLATVPLSLEPPGYPIAIAFLSKLSGIDPKAVAPAIDWVCWALLPSALLFTLRSALGLLPIYIIGALVMIAPGVIENGWQPLTDVPFLLLTIMSFGLLLRGFWPKTNPGLLLLSGLAGGVAYSFRNVGAALFVSVGVVYVVLGWLKILRPMVAIRQLFLWGIGACLVLIPLEVRNLTVFGTFQPYHMAPSELGLSANIRYFTLELLADLTGQHHLVDRFLWHNTIFVVLAIAAIILAFLCRKAVARFRGQAPILDKTMFVAFLVNILAGSAIVILARSHYRWNEFINQRQILQYDWLILVILALLLTRMQPVSRVVTSLLSAAILIFAGFRIFYAWQEISADRQEYAIAMDPPALMNSARPIPYSSALAMRIVIGRDMALIRAINELPADTVLVSNYDDAIRVETGRVAHNVHPEDDCNAIAQALKLQPPSKTAVLVFPFGTILRSGCWGELSRSSTMILPVKRPYLITLGSP